MKRDISGILVLWKEKGITSFQTVDRAKKLYGTKKAGHTGTLDPDVDGILPICLGRATKLVEFLTAEEKTYRGEVTLGFSTTTEDASGEVVEEKRVDGEITEEEILTVFKSFEGEITQTPPMYSAVKVKGKRLYEYAREGVTIDRPSRKVTIHSLTLDNPPKKTEDGLVRFPFTVTCSKGTYVRTLSVMIGEKLGYPAHMSKLTRLSSGKFTKEQSVSLKELEEMDVEGRLRKLITIEEALRHFPAITIDEEMERRVLNGALIKKSTINMDESLIALYNQQGECLALYKDHPRKKGLMKPAKMLAKVD